MTTNMSKQEAVERLSNIKIRIAQMNSYRGQTKDLKDISNKIQFLERYKTDGGNIPRLMVEEVCKYAKCEAEA